MQRILQVSSVIDSVAVGHQQRTSSVYGLRHPHKSTYKTKTHIEWLFQAHYYISDCHSIAILVLTMVLTLQACTFCLRQLASSVLCLRSSLLFSAVIIDLECIFLQTVDDT